ncbi:MAG: hypothetical protein K2K89_06965 [Ruminococcus sp.]|nr:hypothetical protein [Ruminococcus sp.]
MDMATVISVMILAFIAVLELVSILRSRSCNDDLPDYVTIIPVFPEDNNFSFRLECLSEKIACGNFRIEKIILTDYGASPEQLALCQRFCLDNPDAVVVNSEELEKILSEMFAIERIT